MISQKDVEYDYEMQQNISANELREQYKDGIIVWLNASGGFGNGGNGYYRCALDYRGSIKYMEKDLSGTTSNQAMIKGAIDAVSKITLSKRIFLISPVQLGFIGAFKGKGVNSQYLQDLLNLIKQKQCQLTEVQFINGADEIKRLLRQYAPNKKVFDEKKDYKQIICEDCLKKVVQVLERNKVDQGIINEVTSLKPWIYEEHQVRCQGER